MSIFKSANRAAVTLALAGFAALGGAQMKITQNPEQKWVTISDPNHRLTLRINYAERCAVESLVIRNRETLSKAGITSGIKVAGKWFTTVSNIPSPRVQIINSKVAVTGIRFGAGGVEVEESWTFQPGKQGLEWTIDRQYLRSGMLEDTACPNWNFQSMSTWTGALLGTGGVAWCKLFDARNATYAMHSGEATFWNAATNNCLRIESDRPEMAMRFTREPDDTFTLACEATGQDLTSAYGQYRFFRDRQDIWKPTQAAGHIRVTYTLNGLDYAKEYSRGDLKGIDGNAVREIMNTIGRIGAVEDKIVGSNGWYSGYAVLHEPWFALMASAINDPAYTRNLGRSLDYQRDHAVQPDGMVKSRWAYFSETPNPETYDKYGFYECQWGRLMDTQPSYAINVAELFDLNGDIAWIRGQKAASERALDYLLKRDTNGNGLVEMADDSRFAKKSSDWLDVIHASYENAFVNAQMYRALVLWAGIENLLRDPAKSNDYKAGAAKLKARFNRPIDQGGFWDPKNKWYVYWREKDGSVHGNNLTLPVNFMAIGFGICDDAARRKAILDQVEAKMVEQKPFSWPVNIYPYTPDETGNQPFPTYENGDIFLAWAETGIRAYAETNPEIALKYVRNILDRYNKDGLAFQRYLRKDQSGAGDDILAKNCSAVVGLYRDIYGIQPKHDRLFLAPRLPKGLQGTVVRYWLRDRWYRIAPGSNRTSVESEGLRISAPGDFGARFVRGALDYFPRASDSPELSVGSSGPVQLAVESWGAEKRWSVASGSARTVSLTLLGLKPRARFRVRIDGRESTNQASASGEGKVAVRLQAGRTVSFEIRE